jgi:hypothetical protein
VAGCNKFGEAFDGRDRHVETWDTFITNATTIPGIGICGQWTFIHVGIAFLLTRLCLAETPASLISVCRRHSSSGSINSTIDELLETLRLTFDCA